MEQKREVPEPVEMPDSEQIPDASTAGAFGTPVGRDPEERVAEIEDAPQTSEGAEIATVRPVNEEGGQLDPAAETP